MLKHNFALEPETIRLFDGVTSLSQFKTKLEKLSKTLPISNPLRWGRNPDMQDNINKIKGDGFELFCELLVLLMGTHPHIGLTDYMPTDPDSDEGVDAFAKNMELQKSGVQCKYVSDPTYMFTANGSNLANFLVEANFDDIDFKNQQTKRLFLITTAKGLHFHTAKKWRNAVHVIGNSTLKQLVDNNLIFWKNCTEILKGMDNG